VPPRLARQVGDPIFRGVRRLFPTFATLLLFLTLPAARSPVFAQQAVAISPDVGGEALFHLALEARRNGDERLAAVVLVPLWLWVGFASLLNGAVWWLDREPGRAQRRARVRTRHAIERASRARLSP